VVADRPDDLDRTNLFFGGPRYVAGLCPISSDQLYGYVVDEDVRRSRSEGPAFHEVLRERTSGYGSWWETIRAGVGPKSSIDYRSLELLLVDDPWFRGRSIVIGDAAHVCPPMLAQGAAMGAEDAVVLAECLDLDVDVPEMFSRFMARRLPRVRKVVDLSMDVARRELQGATAASETEENVEKTMAEAMVMLCEAP
jgi:2-polyprenyl-6-methoxyphenol hydroxylase-like FAD-dependent oxidoreductase